MKNNLIRRLVSVCSAAAVVCSAGSSLPTGSLGANAAKADIEDFSISDVTMTDDYCTNAFSKELDYLLSFDTEKLLAGFRESVACLAGTQHGIFQHLALYEFPRLEGCGHGGDDTVRDAALADLDNGILGHGKASQLGALFTGYRHK